MTTSTDRLPETRATSEERPTSLLQLKPIYFEQNFGRAPFFVGHSLSQHPLFDFERILELAEKLPLECIEYNAGDLPISIDPNLTPRNGLSPEETIRRIQECQSWMVLKYVERDPEYARLLQECLDEIRPYSDSVAPGMMQPQAFIFVTSPGSVTPYHIDPEHNFLLQIRGTKEIRMLDGSDRSIVSEEDLEQFYGDRGRNLKLNPDHEKRGWTFQLQPGLGLHFPVTYPHWVRNGDAVSVSFSITFRTPDLDRRRALYRVNGDLRRRGFQPWPVGKNLIRDEMLYTQHRIRRKVASM